MDKETLKREFPNESRELYFNTSGITLFPATVKNKVQDFLETYHLDQNAGYRQVAEARQSVREKLASMMNAESSAEVALVHTTAEGANIIANGLDWREGDTVMTLDREYPSTIYPWMNLERRCGIKLDLLKERDGRVDEDEIIEAIRSRRPRLFALSAVEWCSGYRFDLEKIGAVCQETGAFFFVDAAQALGFCEVDVRAACVSAMAGSGWKWLFGAESQGYFYLRRDLLETIDPVFVGSYSVVNSLDYLDYDFTFQPDMRRFEYSTQSLTAPVWLDAGIQFVLDVGLENLRLHVFDLQDYAIERLRAVGCLIRGDFPRSQRSGIMAFQHPACESLELLHRLRKEVGMVAQERDGFIRLAFHVYSTRRGVDQIVDFLSQMS